LCQAKLRRDGAALAMLERPLGQPGARFVFELMAEPK
jgi:hypothetical protein